MPPRLLQLHKQQNKNRPHPHGHRKLRQGRVAHRTSSGKRKRQKEHNQCREYPNHQLAFPVHGRSPSKCAVALIVPQAQPHVSARVYPEGPPTPKNGTGSLACSAEAGIGGTRFIFLNLPLSEVQRCMKLHTVAIGKDFEKKAGSRAFSREATTGVRTSRRPLDQ